MQTVYILSKPLEDSTGGCPAGGNLEYMLSLSTSCGNTGYFPARESLHLGGYEVWVARAFGARIVAEHIDDVLVQAG